MDRSLTDDNKMERLRSYSLLNYLGGGAQALRPDDTGFVARHKQKLSQVTHTATVLAFVCEGQYINDGMFVMFPEDWCDLPGARHSTGCPFTFPDGHAEYWKWKSADLSTAADLARVLAALPDP